MSSIKIVTASRLSKENFLNNSLLGKSIKLLENPSSVKVVLYENNTAGLSSVYNDAIRKSHDDEILVFVHDDVMLLDFFWQLKLRDALQFGEVVGVAGNKRRVERQPGWAFLDDKFTWDRGNLSGAVAHGSDLENLKISFYGAARQKVLLLDGVFLAAKASTLKEKKLYFDERFKFHFYDLDFCRQAEMKDVSMITYDINLLHQSGGSFGSQGWFEAYRMYLNKWLI